jgi:hypothetical protein
MVPHAPSLESEVGIVPVVLSRKGLVLTIDNIAVGNCYSMAVEFKDEVNHPDKLHTGMFQQFRTLGKRTVKISCSFYVTAASFDWEYYTSKGNAVPVSISTPSDFAAGSKANLFMPLVILDNLKSGKDGSLITLSLDGAAIPNIAEDEFQLTLT